MLRLPMTVWYTPSTGGMFSARPGRRLWMIERSLDQAMVFGCKPKRPAMPMTVSPFSIMYWMTSPR